MYKPYTYRIFALLLMLATAFGCRTATPFPERMRKRKPCANPPASC